VERSQRLTAVAAAISALLLAWAGLAQAEPLWPTYHRDAVRSGLDPDAFEPVTPTVAWESVDLGAALWSEPLVVGGRVYVATVGNSVYALEASTGKMVWRKSAGTPVPKSALECSDIEPIGIVGTPVIDTSTNVLYAVADIWDASKKEAHHVLDGFRLSDGEIVLQTSVDPPGSNPKTLLQRTALNLDQGNVVFGYGGNAGDCGVYRGTVVSVPESGGAPSYWQYSPASPAIGGGAVWGPSGPAVDAQGRVYESTGNPDFSGKAEAKTYDYSNSVVQLSPSMSLLGNFEPVEWLNDSNKDLDLSSTGPELLPGGLLFQAGKDKNGYLVDESTMGTGAPAVYSQAVCGGAGSFGGAAFANSTIYAPCNDGVRALPYNQSARTFSVLWQGPNNGIGPPIVAGGLVWVISNVFLKGGGTTLYGLEQATGTARYTVTLPHPVVDHFATPTAAAGRLLLADGSTVVAYNVGRTSSEPPTVTKVAPKKGPAAGGTAVTITGTNFTGVEAVRFGAGAASSFTVVSATRIAAVAPTSVAGSVDVTVTASGGVSATSSKDRFKFAPAITGLSPVGGPKAGGTVVTVSGAGFALGSATVFKFGTAKATATNCTTSTSCTVTAPAHAVGTVDVKATVNKVGSAKGTADEFTYS
jgi:outer membrane protein assembly factor BamB